MNDQANPSMGWNLMGAGRIIFTGSSYKRLRLKAKENLTRMLMNRRNVRHITAEIGSPEGLPHRTVREGKMRI